MAENTVVQLPSAESLQESALKLAQDARRQLAIFTPDLEPFLYNTPAFITASLDLIKRSKHTEIKILAQDVRPALELGHGLLRLLRHTDQQFQIRRIQVDSDTRKLSYLVSDDCQLLRRQDNTVFQGLCYTGDRARVKNQLEEFQRLWNASIEDPDLRILML